MVWLGCLRLGLAVVLAWATGRRVAARLWGRPSAFALALTAHGVALLPLPLLGLAGWLSPGAILTAYGLLWAGVRWALRGTEVRPRPRPGLRALPGLVLWGLLACIVLLYWAPAPAERDDLTYHLFFPARWVQEQRVFIVPTPFGDNAPAYFASNTELLYAAGMALWGSDLPAAVWTAAYTGLLMLAAYELARVVAGGRRWPAVAACLPAMAPLVYAVQSSRGVDVALAVMLAACGLSCLRLLREADWRGALAFGAAAGMCVGVKPLGVPYLLPYAAAALGILFWRRRWAPMLLCLAGVVAFGGWWYLRNLWVTGNPVYPLDVRVLGLHFHGAYSADAIRGGEFYIADRWFLFQRVVLWFGGAACMGTLAVLWLVGLGRKHPRRTACGLVLVGALWPLVCFFCLLPHHGLRFLIPAAPFACAGLGFVGRLLPRRASAALFIVAGAVIGLGYGGKLLKDLVVFWFRFAYPQVIGPWSGIGLVAAVCALGVVAAAPGPRRAWRWCAAGALGLVVALAQHHCDAVRHHLWTRFFGPALGSAWEQLDVVAPTGVIAYTGQNMPYPLMGRRLQHRVMYVNVWGDPQEHFYDFHRRLQPQLRGALARYHKPAYYRRHPDVDQWLANLKAVGASVLAIHRLGKAEARYLRSDADGFPIEREWVRDNEDLFSPVFQSPQLEMYRVNTSGPTPRPVQ